MGCDDRRLHDAVRAAVVAAAGLAACVPRGDPFPSDPEPPLCEPVRARAPAECAGGGPLPAETVFEGGGSPTGFGWECDGDAVVRSAGLCRSLDGGATFEQPAPLPDVPASTFYLSGTTFGGSAERVFFPAQAGDSVVLHATDDGGETWRTSLPIGPAAPYADYFQLATRGAEVVVGWRAYDATFGAENDALWVARSFDRGETFDAAVRADDGAFPVAALSPGGPNPWGGPSMCVAGENAVVVGWRGQPGPTCGNVCAESGRVAVSVDGGPFRSTTLYEGRNSWTLAVACFADGRAVAVWDESAPVVENNGARLGWAVMNTCGVWEPAAALDGVIPPPLGPRFEHVVAGATRALVHWSGADVAPFAVLDAGGALVAGPIVAPDLDADGAGEGIADACATPGNRFAVLGYDYDGALAVTLVAASLDADGGVLDGAVLGEVALDVGVSGVPNVPARVWCDGRGRAHYLWADGWGVGRVARHVVRAVDP